MNPAIDEKFRDLKKVLVDILKELKTISSHLKNKN